MRNNNSKPEELDNDDEPVGKILSRREVLGLFGAGSIIMLGSGLSLASSSATTPSQLPGCIVRPALTEGPFFVDEKLKRVDVRGEPNGSNPRPGATLQLQFMVSSIGKNCGPLAGAMVDIWHCDADGNYSDVQNMAGKKFLRGYQLTDAKGQAQFTTIYPGWYPGRAVHIHFKIRSGNNFSHEFTSQLFFDEKITDLVHANQPYAAKGTGRQPNARDGIYQNGGNQLLIAPKKNAAGIYAATFDIGLQG